MTADSLVDNPFNLLGVSVRSNRDEIFSAYEDALIAGHHEEAVLQKAQQVLLNPRARLDAELTWMPELAPASARAAMAELTRGEFSPVDADRLLDGTTGLARANLAAALCRLFPGQFARVAALVNACGDITRAGAANTVISARSAAGFPPPDSALLDQAFIRLIDAHAKSALECLAAAQHPGRAMTNIVRLKDRGSEKVALVVDSIVRLYDQWSAPHLRKLEEAIGLEIQALRNDAILTAPAARIQTLLLEWDEYSQPAQLIAQSKGLDEPRSNDLIRKIRELCLWMANEKHVYGSTLAMSNAVLHSFSELPWVARQLPQDIETLESLAAEEAKRKRFTPLYDALDNAIANIARFGDDVMRRGFGPRAQGLAKPLYEGAAAAAASMRQGEKLAEPWTDLRVLTLAMHNGHQLTKEAHAVVTALLDFDDAMPAEAATQYRQDEKALRIQLKMAELQAAGQRQDLSASVSIADDILALSEDPEERKTISEIKSIAQARKAAGTRKAVFWFAVAAVVVAVIAYSNMGHKSRSSYTPTASYTPTYTPESTYIPTPSTPTYSSTPTVADDAEALPVPKATTFLTRPELRFCLFQNERLDYLRSSIVSSDDYSNFNGLVDDWNKRCHNRQYWDNDEKVVQSALALARPRLKSEAEGLVRKWHEASTVTNIPTIAPNAGSNLMDLSDTESAKQVQQRLKELGFYRGAVDGVFGNGSRSALKDFKTSHYLGNNDEWNILTQQMLFSR